MKVLFCIASTLLIVFISQHSTIALPLNETTLNETCRKGFELREGRCMPTTTSIPDDHIESSSPSQDTIIREEKPILTLDTTESPRFGSCPRGTVRGAHGICEKRASNDEIQVTTESTNDASTKLGEQDVLQRCAEGTRRGENGVCEKINIDENIHMTTEAQIEITTTATTEQSISNDCPEGKRRGVNGVCENIEMNDQMQVTTQATRDDAIKFSEQAVFQRCPKGTRRGENGVCEDINVDDKIELTTESLVEITTLSTEHDNHPECPEGTRRGENGICEEIKLYDQSSSSDRHSTDDKVARKPCPEGTRRNVDGVCEKVKVEDEQHVTDEVTEETSTKSSEQDIPKGCPEGTELDEEGACVSKKVETTKKLITDLKVLLNEDGSCPENYKKIDGRCLYVKPKKDIKHYFAADDNVVNDSPLKKTDDETSQYELVPVLEDNSCPKGTQYSSYGLCRRPIRTSTPTTFPSVDAHCPENYEFIEGKCAPKKSQVEHLMDLTTKADTTAKPLSEDERPTRFSTKTTPLDETHDDVHQPEDHVAA